MAKTKGELEKRMSSGGVIIAGKKYDTSEKPKRKKGKKR